MHIKNIVIGVLSSVVIADVLLAFMSKNKHVTILEQILSNLDNENVLMVAALSILGGIAVWWCARNSKENYENVM